MLDPWREMKKKFTIRKLSSLQNIADSISLKLFYRANPIENRDDCCKLGQFIRQQEIFTKME
jgi:hypothetical protein